MRAKKKATTKAKTAANVGYEAELSKMADARRCIDGQIARGDTFHDDRIPDLTAACKPAFQHRRLG